MSSPLLDAALAYAAMGWPVFPCNRDKEPLTPHGVLEASTDPAKVRAWWAETPDANIGCHVGAANMLVIDTDPGFDRAELDRAIEGLPKTGLVANTPRGGRHHYFALAEGEVVPPSGSKLAKHVDVRSDRSYVLLSPSVANLAKGDPAAGTGAYVWQHDLVWPPQPMPRPAYRTEAMIRACGEKRQKSPIRTEWLIEPDMPVNIDSAVRWLQSDKCQPAVEGQGGNAVTFSTAAMMRSFGLSEEVALDLLLTVYNSKCSPPWEAEELQVTLDNAYRYATSAPGNMTDAYRAALVKAMFKPAQAQLPSGTERTSGKFRMVDRAGVDHIRDPEWLIPDLLPRGAYGLLAGAPYTFKTFVALDMALSVATGGASRETGRVWPIVKETGRVLMAVGEGRSGLKKRIQAWETLHNAGNPAADIVIADPVPLVSAGVGEWEAFVELALSMSPEGYVLTVIDTAGRAMQGLNENSQEHASLLTQLVQMLQTRLSSAVLVIHHTGHGNQDRAKGSGVFHADPDTVLMLKREGKEPTMSLRMEKQKDAAEWDDVKHLRVVESASSLAVVPANPPAPKAANDPGSPPAAERAVDALIDQIACMLLKQNQSKIWTNLELAEAMAVREDVEVSSRRINGKLIRIRETSGSLCSRHYLPETRRWRWQG